NAQLHIDKFQQAPFDEQKEGSFIRLSRDPSQSDTELDLRNGTLQGEVKQLNTAEKSVFNVKTPAGSAGIRGTIVSLTVVRDAADNVASIIANCATGNMAFTPAVNTTVPTANGGIQTITNGSANVDVNSGGTISISLTPTAGGGLSAVIAGANASTAQ